MKIKTIKIHNYRAFYPQHDENQSPKPYEIAVNGKNVLIYGENGSGKTSLFRAVRDFINSSRTQAPFDLNAFATLKANSIQDGEISLEFENGDIFKFTNHASLNDANQNSNISLADKASGWLTYSEILKTYLVDKGKPDLFNLLVEDILKNHLLPPSNGETVKEEWEKLLQNIKNDRRKTSKNELFKNRELNCDIFNIGFKTLLKGIPKVKNDSDSVSDVIGIETILNEWLDKYFNNGLKINFNFQEVQDYSNDELRIKRHELKKSLTLDIELHGKQISKSDYQNFLNEARLSALAICIFLAAFKTYPTDTVPTKIIYLDDVFIGLDMSNRLPLLEILEKEFITEGYQVFISTYDKAWFELAKKYLVVEDWCAIEMYHSKSDIVPNIEIPVIISPSASNLEKVMKCISICDYPAAANYLRKHIEGLIKERLTEEDVRQFSNKYKTLDILWKRLLERYKNADINLPEDINREFQTSKTSILNPLSHYSLSTPVYLSELNKAIKIAEEIEKIPVIKTFCFLPKGTLFYYSSPTYSLIFKLNSDWYIKKEANIINHKNGEKFSYFKWREKGVRYYNQKTELPFTQVEINKIIKHDNELDDVLKELNKHQNLQSTNEDLMKLIHIKSIGNFSKTLNNTLEFLSKNDFLHLFK